MPPRPRQAVLPRWGLLELLAFHLWALVLTLLCVLAAIACVVAAHGWARWKWEGVPDGSRCHSAFGGAWEVVERDMGGVVLKGAESVAACAQPPCLCKEYGLCEWEPRKVGAVWGVVAVLLEPNGTTAATQIDSDGRVGRRRRAASLRQLLPLFVANRVKFFASVHASTLEHPTDPNERPPFPRVFASSVLHQCVLVEDVRGQRAVRDERQRDVRLSELTDKLHEWGLQCLRLDTATALRAHDPRRPETTTQVILDTDSCFPVWLLTAVNATARALSPLEGIASFLALSSQLAPSQGTEGTRAKRAGGAQHAANSDRDESARWFGENEAARERFREQQKHPPAKGTRVVDVLAMLGKGTNRPAHRH